MDVSLFSLLCSSTTINQPISSEFFERQSVSAPAFLALQILQPQHQSKNVYPPKICTFFAIKAKSVIANMFHSYHSLIHRIINIKCILLIKRQIHDHASMLCLKLLTFCQFRKLLCCLMYPKPMKKSYPMAPLVVKIKVSLKH